MKTVSLKQLVSGLVSGSFQHLAVKKNSFIVNNISDSILTDADSDTLTGVIGGLLGTIITGNADSCIHITAKNYGNITLLHIKTEDKDRIFSYELNTIQRQAQQLGGCVTVNTVRDSGVLTLSFLRMANVA